MFNKIYQKVGFAACTKSDTFRVHGCRFGKRLLRCHLRECRTPKSF